MNEIDLTFIDSFDLSDEFFDNINAIKPKKLSLNFNTKILKSSNIFRIFTKLQWYSNLKLNNDALILNGWRFKFFNVPILLKSNKVDPIFIKWNALDWYFDMKDISDGRWFISKDSNDENKK